MKADQLNNTTSITANPHETTRIEGIATWGCLLDVAGDGATWNGVSPLFQEYGGSKFDHLRCSYNAGEDIGQTVLKSVWFWVFLLTLGFIIITIEFLYIRLNFWKRKWVIIDGEEDDSLDDIDLSKSSEEFTVNDQTSRALTTSEKEGGCESTNSCDESTVNDQTNRALIMPEKQRGCESTISGEVDSFTSITNMKSSRCISQTKRWCLLTVIVLFNLLVLFVIFMSILSLISFGVDLQPFALKMLTPACNADLICPSGRDNIDNPSVPNAMMSSEEEFQPFSYIIASDAQLEWYDGESAHLGKTTYPPPCTAGDTCGSCTSKTSHYTNLNMKYAMESLIHADDDSNPTASGGPAPKTLIMNGDLTAYFHRRERKQYEELFHNIQGLEEYYPGLGNHDYDQGFATYSGDDWSTHQKCNSMHALEYFRGAFCNNVPNFDANKRITRYDSKSLAYSWEKGPYHFVQLHYFPHYENAKLGISNSLAWLERDLNLASEANLTSIIYVHSYFHLSSAVKRMFLKNNVAAIFTGHQHKCFGQRCAEMSPLSEWQVDQIVNKTKYAEYVKRDDKIEKCFPGLGALCSSDVSRYGQDLFSLNYADLNFTLPDRKLHWSPHPPAKPLCPVSNSNATFINTTDNTLLCRLQTWYHPVEKESDHPIEKESDEESNTSNKSSSARNIPVFWSGSSSFETFILTDFYHDKFVVNFMTALKGNEGARYIDVQKVPNAVYPSHEESDLNEVTIHI